MTARVLGSAIVVLIVAAGLGGCAIMEYSLWTECRVDHSVLFCFRVLGR